MNVMTQAFVAGQAAEAPKAPEGVCPDATEFDSAPRESYINAAACRRHALKVSKETRGGKFERVSKEFLDNIGATLDAKLRSLRAKTNGVTGIPVDMIPGEMLLSAKSKKLVVEAVNEWLAEEIHRQTKNVRTGKTL